MTTPASRSDSMSYTDYNSNRVIAARPAGGAACAHRSSPKIMRHLLVVFLFSLSACEKDADEVRFEVITTDQSEVKVITLAPNTEYILRLSDPNSQRFIVNVGAGEDFSFAKLSDNPDDPLEWPITITGSGRNIRTERSFYSEGVTLLISDEDGDGFPDTRAHLPGTLADRDESRSATIEKVTHSFERIEAEGRKLEAAEPNEE